MEDKERNALRAKVLDAVAPGASGRLHLSPRSGKTRIILDIIRRDGPRCVLWVTPEAKLATVDIPAEYGKWGMEPYLDRLTTVTWASLNKVTGDWDLIVLDEEQHATENRCSTLLDGSLRGRTISMTGTPSRDWDKLGIYQRLGLPVLYRLGMAEAVDRGILSDYGVRVVRVPISPVSMVEGGNRWKKFMVSEQSNYNWVEGRIRELESVGMRPGNLLIKRMWAIKNSPTKLAVAKAMAMSLKGRRVFFCPSIAHAESLGLPTWHSQKGRGDYEKFQSGEVDSIAMVNAGGTGHTYRGVDHLVLVQADSDRNGTTTQKLARALLRQEGHMPTIWVLCLMGTRDEDWVASALSAFDGAKVTYRDFDVDLAMGTNRNRNS